MTPEQQDALLKTIQELGDEVYRGTIDDEQRLIEEWRKDGTMEIVEDVDVAAFQARCRKYFSSGFEFSDLYNRITAEPSKAEPLKEDAQ